MPWLPVLFSRYALIGYAVAAVLALVGLWVLDYGADREQAGKLAERARWERQVAEWTDKSRQAAEALVRANLERDAAIAERDRLRRTHLARTQEEISNAPDFETRYSAYLNHRNRLRQRGAERHLRARADYLSSVAPDPDRGAGGGGSEFRLVAFGREPALCDPA